MWRLLSGIALILLLDVVFIWMMAIEPDAPEIAQAIGPTAAVPVIHEEPIEQPQPTDQSRERIRPEDAFDRESKIDRVSKRFASRKVSQIDNGSEKVVASAPPNLFQDTIIWIGRTEVPVKIREERTSIPVRSEAPQTSVATVDVGPEKVEKREAKKRSFESRAFSVVKKPYDWVKTLATKLY